MQQAPTPNEINSPGSVLDANRRLEPTDNDIVFGRGKKYQDHEGNKRMRQCINEYKKLYNALKRFQKQALVENIYEKLVEGGARFLRKDEATDTWVLVERELATQKVSHALRCKKHLGKPGSLKKIQESKKKSSSSSISSASSIGTTADMASVDSINKKQMQLISPTSSEAGRVTPVMESVLSSKTVAGKSGPTTATRPTMAHMAGGPSIPPAIATLQVLQTLQMQDMMYQQQMLAMMAQRQAQQQAASVYYNAAVKQLLGIQKSSE